MPRGRYVTKENVGGRHAGIGKDNPRWKGGRCQRPDGYIHVYTGYDSDKASRYKLEHRMVAEAALGRKLKTNECVHHINMNKADNRPCNLLVCTRAYNTWLLKRYAELYAKEHFNAVNQ